MPTRHVKNISDFVWFQRSCGSMKSVSSFSSIDTHTDQDHLMVLLFKSYNPLVTIGKQLT